MLLVGLGVVGQGLQRHGVFGHHALGQAPPPLIGDLLGFLHDALHGNQAFKVWYEVVAKDVFGHARALDRV